MIAQKGKENIASITASILDFATREGIQNLIDCDVSSESKIVFMPDCHVGIGCPVGNTMTLANKVAPGLIGPDGGCGVLAYKFTKEKINFKKMDSACHKVPSGFKNNLKENKEGLSLIKQLKCYPDAFKKNSVLSCAIGSLGGGNHFIEVEEDDDGWKYLVIHSGSRSIGQAFGKYYEYLARHSNRRGDLSYLTDDDMFDYLHDLKIIQKIASLNREEIARTILETYFERKFGNLKFERIESVHNYVDYKRMILRKGSISAEKDELCIIPLNMATGSLLCKGKGNSEWNYSAPHGAGRAISRSDAKSTLSMDQYKKEMSKVYSSTIEVGTIAESPMAYKNSENIIDDIKETVEIIKHLKSIYNFKSVAR